MSALADAVTKVTVFAGGFVIVLESQHQGGLVHFVAKLLLKIYRERVW